MAPAAHAYSHEPLDSANVVHALPVTIIHPVLAQVIKTFEFPGLREGVLKGCPLAADGDITAEKIGELHEKKTCDSCPYFARSYRAACQGLLHLYVALLLAVPRFTFIRVHLVVVCSNCQLFPLQACHIMFS